MSNHISLKPLFTALHGSLPYEYDVLYVNGENAGDSISISKTGSAGIVCITADETDNNCIFDISAYDDAYDDDPAEITIGDADNPEPNLIDLIAYIEKSL